MMHTANMIVGELVRREKYKFVEGRLISEIVNDVFDMGVGKINAELLEACKLAETLVRIARKYFPGSIQNTDRFDLENTCATLGKAISKAEGM